MAFGRGALPARYVGTPVVELRDSQAYKEDWLGLKTLDSAKKIDFLQFPGEHIRFSAEFWSHRTVLLYFA
jgi:palmitoyl-protein thioesterase